MIRSGFTCFVLLLVGLLLAGCSSGFKKAPAPPVEPMITALEDWPEVYRRNFEKLNSFKGKARLSIESAEFSGHVSVFTYWMRPDKLYLKAEGLFGLDIGKIFMGKDRFIVYYQHNNHFVSGSIDDPYLNRFWETNITLKELRHAILGYALQSDGPLYLEDSINGIFTSRDDELEYRYIVNPGSGLLETCEVSRDGRVFIRQDFKNYRVFDGVFVPTLVQVTLLDQKERVSIFYKDIDVNVPIDPSEYTIEISSKVEQLNVN